MKNPNRIRLRSELRLRNMTLLRLFLQAAFPFSGKRLTHSIYCQFKLLSGIIFYEIRFLSDANELKPPNYLLFGFLKF